MAANIQLRVVYCQQLIVVLIISNMQPMVEHTEAERFATRLNKLLDIAGAPKKNAGRARWFHDFIKGNLNIKISYEACRKWLNGDSMPYTKRISAIAKGLNSTAEYLLGDETAGQQTQGVKEASAPYSKEDVELLNQIHELDPADRARLSGIIAALNPKLDKDTGNHE
ncbi:MAG: hypothetical protein OEY66_07300 [Gammaproteobacteria bacterium]|nr:hypothetical protein [Gammaproteobacteria bacterium]